MIVTIGTRLAAPNAHPSVKIVSTTHNRAQSNELAANNLYDAFKKGNE